MGAPDFAAYLRGRGLDPAAIDRSIAAVAAFEAWLRATRNGTAADRVTADDASRAVAALAERGELEPEDLLAIARYMRFVGNSQSFVALAELLDGAEVPANLASRLAGLAGEEVRDAVFAGLDIPPLATPARAKPAFTRALVDRLERHVDAGLCEAVLTGNLHYVPREAFAEDRERFVESADIDVFTRDHQERFIQQLEGLRDRGELYFTQPVTDDVIEYVRATPTCTPGVREGAAVRVTKIPYMTDEFLREADGARKRYLCCHCSWVRESLLDPDVTVSPRFCQCSAGFEKQFWDAVLEEPVRVDVVRSVLRGDEICEFAVHLPAWAVPEPGAMEPGAMEPGAMEAG